MNIGPNGWSKSPAHSTRPFRELGDREFRATPRGIRRGEVRGNVRVEVARELGQALLWHRFLVTGDEVTAELIEHIVDAILIPYVAPHSPS